MVIVAIAWIFVVVLMAAAEATSPQGTLLGAFFTLLLYGALPLSIVLYLLGTPMRRRARYLAERAELEAAAESQTAAAAAAQAQAAAELTPAAGPTPETVRSAAAEPDGRGVAAGDAVAPVRKEP